MQSIGLRLQAVMDEKEASAYAVAKNTGISESTIGRILKDKNTPNQETIFLISDYLEIDPRWLKLGVGDKDRPFSRKHQSIIYAMEDSRERLFRYLESIDSNIRDLAIKSAIPLSRIYKVMDHEEKFTNSELEVILQIYPRLNPSWLIKGEGDMLIEVSNIDFKKNKVSKNPDSTLPTSKQFNDMEAEELILNYKDLIAFQRTEIEKLKKQIESLKQEADVNLGRADHLKNT